MHQGSSLQPHLISLTTQRGHVVEPQWGSVTPFFLQSIHEDYFSIWWLFNICVLPAGIPKCNMRSWYPWQSERASDLLDL